MFSALRRIRKETGADEVRACYARDGLTLLARLPEGRLSQLYEEMMMEEETLTHFIEWVNAKRKGAAA